jgi:hypothetical protein
VSFKPLFCFVSSTGQSIVSTAKYSSGSRQNNNSAISSSSNVSGVATSWFDRVKAVMGTSSSSYSNKHMATSSDGGVRDDIDEWDNHGHVGGSSGRYTNGSSSYSSTTPPRHDSVHTSSRTYAAAVTSTYSGSMLGGDADVNDVSVHSDPYSTPPRSSVRGVTTTTTTSTYSNSTAGTTTTTATNTANGVIGVPTKKVSGGSTTRLTFAPELPSSWENYNHSYSGNGATTSPTATANSSGSGNMKMSNSSQASVDELVSTICYTTCACLYRY